MTQSEEMETVSAQKRKNGGKSSSLLPDKQLQDILSELPEEKRGELIASLQMQAEVFQGPFPHPEHLAEYQNYCPDFLPRSLAMAEQVQAANIEHRRFNLENERLEPENKGKEIERRKSRDRLDSRDTARGQYLGFTAFVLLCICAFAAMYWGYEKIALVFFGAGALSVISKFLMSKFSAAGLSKNKKSEQNGAEK